jgi:Skp family chaperone for outer membrane proteins
MTRSVLAVAFGLCCAVSLRAADMKIAVVDMEQALTAHPDTKDAEKLIQKQIEEFEAERDELVKKFEKMRKDFEDVRAEAENKALSEEGRALKRKDAERRIEEMRDFDEQVRQTTGLRQKQIKDRKSRMRQRIVDDIKALVREYALKNGYALVLDAGPVMDAFGVVVHSADGMDITAAISKLLAETRKPTLEAAEAAAPKPASEKEPAK